MHNVYEKVFVLKSTESVEVFGWNCFGRNFMSRRSGINLLKMSPPHFETGGQLGSHFLVAPQTRNSHLAASQPFAFRTCVRNCLRGSDRLKPRPKVVAKISSRTCTLRPHRLWLWIRRLTAELEKLEKSKVKMQKTRTCQEVHSLMAWISFAGARHGKRAQLEGNLQNQP